MHYIPFNSRQEHHKAPFGAATCGGEIRFRVILPRELRCRAVRLVIHRDDLPEHELYAMDWERMESENEEWWALSYSPPARGLYWYRFEYDTDWGAVSIGHAGNGLGKIAEGGEWQLTVCSERFKTPEWIKGGVIYQIFPDRFFRSDEPKTDVSTDRLLRDDWGGEPMWSPDKNGSITRYDYFGGDLCGITEKLPYIASLGVNCIYLNPIFEAHSNHRYDTADYMKIDPLLGNERDFRELCDEAMRLGIRILLDGVFSHTGADSRYFNKKGRYETKGAYQTKDSEYYGWYRFSHWPDEYKSWWGINILPEVNEESPGFADFVTGERGVLKKWMRLGASGWRLDVADELPDSLLDRISAAVKEENPGALIIGEVWEDATNKISHGGRRRYLQGGQLDGVMNYPFADAVITFIKTGGKSGGAEKFMETIMSLLENYPKQAIDCLMNHIGTHDTARALTLFSGGKPTDGKRRKNVPAPDAASLEKGVRLLKMAAAVQYTLPGVPSVYYGDEAGMLGGNDPFNRGCFPWDNINGELFTHYRALGELRKRHGCFQESRFEPVSATLGCVAFARAGDGDGVLTIANRNEHGIEYRLPGGWRGASLELGGEMLSEDVVKIGACETVLLARIDN
ncbi:MAG: glycoside hydrolase family 13 protein [Oscillospiraceae bacterium]|nr:glycoside hydrolase family 13 protein [Oscillospiraceae bacterium]